jgi:two-component system capsular synthesis sensor histidine kinase RcsC
MFQLKDLQDMSNIVREQFKVQMASFNVRDAVNEIISMYKMSADLKRINIECHISDDVPQELIQDKLRVQQIISNLVNNSLKYSDNDTEINIRCRFFPRSSKLHIQVLDNGIGIAEKDAEVIFKPYTTLPEAENLAQVGAGLGLYTCKKLCK